MGVDTGGVLKQVFAKPAKADNFTTYPVIQVAEGIKALKIVIAEFNGTTIAAITNTEKGKMYFQPTIWQYLINKIK